MRWTRAALAISRFAAGLGAQHRAKQGPLRAIPFRCARHARQVAAPDARAAFLRRAFTRRTAA